MKDVLTIILGGGKGTRLYPLTKDRAKPACPFGGKYRLVDIPISNSINSGFRRIYVLTQFNSASLHLHIGRTYNFDPFSQDKVQYMLGPYSSGLTKAIAPITEKYKIRRVEAEGASRSVFNKKPICSSIWTQEPRLPLPPPLLPEGMPMNLVYSEPMIKTI